MGFESKNLSSILNGAGANLNIAINALCNEDNIEKLKSLLKSVEEGGLGFESKNLSSILNGAGANLDKAINILSREDIREKLQSLLASVNKGKWGFEAQNLSSIFHKLGANLGKAVFDLSEKDIAKFKFLTSTRDSGEVSGAMSYIRGVSRAAIRTRVKKSFGSLPQALKPPSKKRPRQPTQKISKKGSGAAEGSSDFSGNIEETYEFVGERTNLTHRNILTLSRHAFTSPEMNGFLAGDDYDALDPVKFAAYADNNSLDHSLEDILKQAIEDPEVNIVPVLLCRGKLQVVNGREQIVGDTHWTSLIITKHFDERGSLTIRAKHMNSMGDEIPSVANRVISKIRRDLGVNFQDCTAQEDCAKQVGFHDCGDTSVYNLIKYYRLESGMPLIGIDKGTFIANGRAHLQAIFNAPAAHAEEAASLSATAIDLIRQVNSFLDSSSADILSKLTSLLAIKDLLKKELPTQKVESFFLRALGGCLTEIFAKEKSGEDISLVKESLQALLIAEPYLQKCHELFVLPTLPAEDRISDRDYFPRAEKGDKEIVRKGDRKLITKDTKLFDDITGYRSDDEGSELDPDFTDEGEEVDGEDDDKLFGAALEYPSDDEEEELDGKKDKPRKAQRTESYLQNEDRISDRDYFPRAGDESKLPYKITGILKDDKMFDDITGYRSDDEGSELDPDFHSDAESDFTDEEEEAGRGPKNKVQRTEETTTPKTKTITAPQVARKLSSSHGNAK